MHICALILSGCAHTAPAPSGMHSTTSHDGNRHITTFTRDGEQILTRERWQDQDHPERLVITQRVVYKGRCILEIVDIGGDRSFSFKSNAPVEIGVSVDASGRIKGFVLTDKELTIVECFNMENNLLLPLSSDELHRSQAVGTDLMNLFGPKNMKRLTPDQFADEAVGIVKKHKKKCSTTCSTRISQTARGLRKR